MIIFKDILSDDEMLSDSYDMTEVQDGFFYEVPGKWVEVGDVNVDIGANPSAEGGDDEGADSSSRKVVDIIDAFRLQETQYDKKSFMAYLKPWLAKVLAKLPADQQDEFKAKSQTALKFLVGKVKELQFFTTEAMDPEATMVYAYYAEGSSSPTFLYPKYALLEQKC